MITSVTVLWDGQGETVIQVRVVNHFIGGLQDLPQGVRQWHACNDGHIWSHVPYNVLPVQQLSPFS